jgi:hypothetical protein
MGHKIYCDECGGNITQPIPYRLRYQKDTEYTTKQGQTKIRKAFVTFDFDLPECLTKHIKENTDVFNPEPKKPRVVSIPIPSVSGGTATVSLTVPEGGEESKSFVCPNCHKSFDKEIKLKIHSSLAHR